MNHTPEPFDLPRLHRRFFEKYGHTESTPNVFHAPGRVNLIGEHTDYTGGMVFPCAIDRGTLLLVRRTGNGQFRFASTNFDLMAQLSGEELGQTYGDSWINYPLGVIDQFRRRGVELDGLDCLFSGNVPNGAGLSSSASIEVVTAFAINELFATDYALMDLVHLTQAAENDFVGMNCGIMDQFAVDCDSLDYRHVPLALGEHAIVLANTNQRRELNESAYNDRVRECARALEYVQQKIDVNSLGAVKEDQLLSVQPLFADDAIAWQRAQHIVTENARVRTAVTALERQDLAAFGALMHASHASLRDQFAVSSQPLDTLVKLAMEHPGVIGARLTGAGFGGCTVNLMHQDSVESFHQQVGHAYRRR